ncbi:exodeoxyribonuclease VII large subunit [Clostridium hydrogeniformans]|uniref:exodeoxyribonuclease VII large subunit n=1 Tax=Clostridium hydrogeniformans TaxID=349933 RepID=UPI000482DF82|nr:exodeoxyribonuclease VII large subunit [Clostridium hydrogeniformans]
MYIKTLTVSALNNYIKRIIDSDIILNNVSIKGEISNFKLHSSGHMYFSLKDDLSKINCVMFKDRARSVNFAIEEGMKVEIKGRVGTYTKEGSYQLYCDEIKKEGLGDLYQAFLKLKDELKLKGLMEEEHKKPLPPYPRRIGVITSSTGAAIRDIINVSKRRNNSMSLLIYPSLVQGKDASENIIKGIKALNKIKDIDVIILARGGGSIEELWAFNDEKLAYAIFNSKVPIVTGVGHETDFTIADFVSDRRAPTPSAAAEIVVPSLENLNNEVDSINSILKDRILNILKENKFQLDLLKRNLDYNSPKNYLINEYENLIRLKQSLNTSILRKIDYEKNKINNLNSLLMAHNPLNILNKGYAIIKNEEKVITSKEEFNETMDINIVLKDGEISGTFISK